MPQFSKTFSIKYFKKMVKLLQFYLHFNVIGLALVLIDGRFGSKPSLLYLLFIQQFFIAAVGSGIQNSKTFQPSFMGFQMLQGMRRLKMKTVNVLNFIFTQISAS